MSVAFAHYRKVDNLRTSVNTVDEDIEYISTMLHKFSMHTQLVEYAGYKNRRALCSLSAAPEDGASCRVGSASSANLASGTCVMSKKTQTHDNLLRASAIGDEFNSWKCSYRASLVHTLRIRCTAAFHS